MNMTTLDTTSNIPKDLCDLNYLLYLKSKKKVRNGIFIRQVLEENERQFLAAKGKYVYFYKKYMSCAKLAATSSMLENHFSVGLTESCCNEAKKNIATINHKIESSTTVSAHVDEQMMADFKTKLHLQPDKLHDTLLQLREEITDENKAAVDICTEVCNIGSDLEAATEEILDNFVNELKTEDG